MRSNDIFALVLIVIVAFSALVYFIIKRNRKTNRINSLLKNHSAKIALLLNKEKEQLSSTLTKEDVKKILSLSDNYWQEWNEVSKRVSKLGNSYPETIYEFISEYFPDIKYRTAYKKKINLFAPIPQKVKVVIASMLLEELRMIDADSETIWRHRDDMRLCANNIIQNFPDGYKTYREIYKSKDSQYNEIVSNKKQIAELQKIYVESKEYEGWEKKQEDFSSKFWHILKDVRSQDGRFSYDVSFNKTNRRGLLIESKFKVWQGFCDCFSTYLLDRQTDDFLSKYKKIGEFESRDRYFYEYVYDNIFEIINKFDKEIEGNLFVIMVDNCKRNWSKKTYDYHYEHIRKLIDDSDIHRFNLSELPLINDNGNIGGIFILDFITSNDELMKNCKMIIEHFNKSVPFIGYYSMEKEYEEKELLEIAKNNKGYYLYEKNDEFSDVKFIKESILQVRKHSFYSYLAIPNTWIGNASGANETKRKWLDNPNMYIFMTMSDEGCISGKYSVDGGANFNNLSIKGDCFNIDDTSQFTYRLLKEMGILNMFKKNGHKAIEYMNSMEFLVRK